MPNGDYRAPIAEVQGIREKMEDRNLPLTITKQELKVFQRIQGSKRANLGFGRATRKTSSVINGNVLQLLFYCNLSFTNWDYSQGHLELKKEEHPRAINLGISMGIRLEIVFMVLKENTWVLTMPWNPYLAAILEQGREHGGCNSTSTSSATHVPRRLVGVQQYPNQYSSD
ncbi:hypothetical protein M9H77_30937 [Catharanthus roseus]|uniref:Uncharacterized protein n=1 Tax=Catharanthus roseus TaxID=4058 RepID=A0ACC0A0I7_CATRO|nr:hypothetical protein M9H77_30937 [Catharanthus roseus]